MGSVAKHQTSRKLSIGTVALRTIRHLSSLLSYFDYLWSESGSGTDHKLEKGGVIGIEDTRLGGYQDLKSRTYAGTTYEDNMGPDFASWVHAEASSNAIEVVFWVHTHPNGTREPSPLPGSSKKTGDKPTAGYLGIDGIVVTANTLGIFNEVGLYCEFNRSSSNLTVIKRQ